MRSKKGVVFIVWVLLLANVMPLDHVHSAESQDNGEFEVVSESSYEVSPGVHHTSRTLAGDDLIESVQLLEIDPQHPFVRLVPYSSKGEVSRLETVGNMIKEYNESGEQVVAGINGDFFSSVGVPSGLQIMDGEVITSPRNIKALMLIFPDQSVKLEDSVRMTATITASSGRQLELDMVNRTRVPSHDNRAFLFNYRFGPSARTPVGGVEVIVDVGDDNDKFIAGNTMRGVVKALEETADSLIDRGTIVLSATGEKADWIKSQLAPGEDIQVDITFDKDVNQAQQAISGNSTLGTVLLKDGEVIDKLLDPSDPNNTEKHPRTILATKQGKLYMMTVDGRQHGHSDGMTLPGAARYLQSLGMERAINIDGGGSTTYYAREPGEQQPKLLNLPSDGHERPVGNSLLVVSKAPQQSELSGVSLFPSSPFKIVAGSDVRITPKGYDRHLHPVAVEPKDLTWTVTAKLGTIDRSGLFKAGEGNAEGEIFVRKGAVVQTKRVTVTDEVEHIELSPTSFIIEPGKSQPFLVKAYDTDGNRLLISPDVLNWSVKGRIGTISDEGILRTGTEEATGKVIAHYGTLTAESNVHVGPSPVIEDFEDDLRIRAAEVRTVPGSVNLSLVSQPDPIRFGQHAAKLTYDFTGTPGTSGAYIEFLNDDRQVGREIEGEPKQLGMWVYGDAKFHWLRLGVTDADGNNMLWNLTTVGGINWTGWRYVYAIVPEDSIFPITVRNVVVEEKNQHNKTAGTLYFDRFHAVYADAEQQPNVALLMEDYIRGGELHGPLAKQLTNKLKQVDHHLNNGSRKRAAKFMTDFLQRLNHPAMQRYITVEAKDALNREANEWLSEFNK